MDNYIYKTHHFITLTVTFTEFQTYKHHLHFNYTSILECVLKNYRQKAVIVHRLIHVTRRLCSINKCRRHTHEDWSQTPADAGILVKRQEEGCMLLILNEKARFETKDATTHASYNQHQLRSCLVSDQLNDPHYRKPWLSTTNIWRMNSTNITRDAEVSLITQTFVT